MRVIWHHEFLEEPVVMLSEVDNGCEIRKVEKFRDGRTQYAGADRSTGDTALSESKMPLPEEIEEDPQFSVELIDADCFEIEWRAATCQ